MARSNASLLSIALLFAATMLAMNYVTGSAFVPPAQQGADAVQLRGASAIAATAAAGAPLAAHAVDEYLPYRMNGEWQIDLVIEYFLMTSAMTLFAFGCYFVLVKLKII
eukprot:TRINITY_DN8603_c0_g2_i2.p1 TRINITY_DN8603_c0_g2~~TRINITY_DN8603_c0_g2_i2.p1  ORF type:complete len:109 (-),score=34.25 TRINITY_DN8603_c0_g2_i2:172-498(-)